MVEDSDWENSDASSDNEDYSLLASTQPDPLKQAESTAESNEEHEETAQPVTTTPQTSPTDSTNSEVTNSILEAPHDSTVTSNTLSTMQFSEPVGPAIEMESTATALNFFNITFGNDIMELIVEQTNLYAEQNPPSARYKWYDTTVSEMYLFLGIIIAMGVHFLPSFTDYWSSDSLLGIPRICAGMPIDCFKALLHCMHINDNTKAVPRSQPGYDRLHKLRPMIQRLQETWRTCYHPPQEQSIDEAMVGFKGKTCYEAVHAHEAHQSVRQEEHRFIKTICPWSEQAQVMHKNKDGSRTAVACPLAVKLYNENMGGVDLADSKRQVYICPRKAKKWWHRLFYFFLDIGVVNTHILETESLHCVRRSQKEFRIELAREMIAQHSSRKRKGRFSVDSAPPSLHFCECHFPDLLPSVLNCRYCSTKDNRKKTKYCCKQYNGKELVPLCVVPCFWLYHTEERRI